MSKITQHVVKTPTGKWAIKKGGSSKATKIYNTQKEAIKHGTEIAKNQKAELYIHKENGQIREKNSYGNDPCPPKDK